MRTSARIAAVWIVGTILGLATWEFIGFLIACLALVLACVALVRSGLRDDEVAAWKTDQLSRARQQGATLSDELRED